MPETFFSEDQQVVRNNMFFVPWSLLRVLDGSNPDEFSNDRQDYGTAEEMDELAESLYHEGPRVPMKGYVENGTYVVIVGHRRHRAGGIVMQRYGKDLLFPFTKYPKDATKADMLLDTLLTNSGKNLTPLEQASTVSKLLAEKTPVKRIAKALGGVSEVYVKNLRRLWDEVPEEGKKLIRENTVKATTIMGYLKNKNADINELIQQIKEVAAEAPKGGKGTRKKAATVTATDLKKKQRQKSGEGEVEKLNSWAEFKRLKKAGLDTFENKHKQEAYEFLCSIANNSLTYSQLLEHFTGK